MSNLDIPVDETAACRDEFVELVVRHMEGQLTGSQRDRFNTLVAEDAGNRRALVDISRHAYLLMSGVGLTAAEQAPGSDGSNDEYGKELKDESPADEPHYVVPPVHPSSFIFHSIPIARGLVLSYVAVILLLGFGILVAWTWAPPRPRHDCRRAAEFTCGLGQHRAI